MRKTALLPLLLLLVGGKPADAAPRHVISELMTATWCPYCPDAEAAIMQLLDEYDDNVFTPVAYHVNDEYSNPESDERLDYYSLIGTPTNVIDGDWKYVGGGSVYGLYHSAIEADRAEDSALSLRTTGSIVDDRVEYTVVVTPERDPGLVDPKLRVVLYETGLFDAGEPMTGIARRIDTHSVVGLPDGPSTYTGAFTIEEGWVWDEMNLVAFVQDDGSSAHPIVQGAPLALAELKWDKTLVTAEDDLERTIECTLTNDNSYPIDMHMRMDQSQLPEGWFATFCINEWGICLPDSANITMPADSTVTLKMQWIVSGDAKTGQSTFFIHTGDDRATVRGITFTARAGKVELAHQSMDVDDDALGGSYGNDNGLIEAGELIQFNTHVRNTGELLAYDVTSEISTPHTDVFIMAEPVEEFGDIDAGAEVVGSGGRFAVAETAPPGTYKFYQTFHDGEGATIVDSFYVDLSPTGIDGSDGQSPPPQMAALEQNVPNPFNPRTTIRFAVPQKAGEVELTVFDSAGRAIRTLVRGTLAPGRHAVVWDGTDDRGAPVPTGVYLYRLETPETQLTRRMLLVK